MSNERVLPGLGGSFKGFGDKFSDDWHLWADFNWLQIAVMMNGNVLSQVTTLPGSPSEGEIYIVKVGDANEKKLAVYTRTDYGPSGSAEWIYYDPIEGWVFYVLDEDANYQYDGAAWVLFGAALDINGLAVDGSPDGATDYVAIYDDSAGENKKVLLDNLPGGGGGEFIPKSPTRTIVNLSGSSAIVSIPDGVTWFRFQSGLITVTSTSSGPSASLRHGADVTQLWTGYEEIIITSLVVVPQISVEPFVFVGGDGGGTSRSLSGTVYSPRDASKKTIALGHGLAHGQPSNRDRVFTADAAEDDHTMVFGIGAGTFTGTIQFEWFYDGGPVLADINTQLDNYTLALTDAADIVEMNKATANTLTIPTNAAVPFPIGTVISIIQLGAGVTSVTADAGVTLNGVSAGSGDMTNAFDAVSIYKRGTDEWVVNGAIGDVV